MKLTSLDLNEFTCSSCKSQENKFEEIIINKSNKKDLFLLKIYADLKIFKRIILICFIAIIVTNSIYFKPKDLKIGYYSTPLLLLPFIIISIVRIFNKHYLKYSNSIVKTTINLLGFYLFICSFLFISFILIRLLMLEIAEKYFFDFIYFLPLIGSITLIIFFWLFLYEGFKKCVQRKVFLYTLFNLFILLGYIIVFYIKIVGQIPYIRWVYLFSFLNIYHLANFLVINLHQNCENTFSNHDFNSNKVDSFHFIFDLLINIFFACFICLLGIYLDNKMDKIKLESIFLTLNFTFLAIFSKNLYKIRKINSFLEWKKLNLDCC